MELNFDKEIDAILRKSGPDHTGASDGFAAPHLDADEISAFAENALPENTKIRCTAHLADCERCRKILSNLILLNTETASEFVHAETSAAVIPWYRKLFVFPNFAYSLGALALVFGAMVVFTILQSNTFQNAEISQISNKPLETKSASTTNTTASSSQAEPPANLAATNTSIEPNGPADHENAPPKPAPMMSNETDGVITSQDRTDAKTVSNLAKDQPFSIDGASGTKPVLEPQKRAEEVKNDADDKKLKTEQQAPAPGVLGNVAATKVAKKKSDQIEDSTRARENETTKVVSGKTFRRQGGAWIDSEYQSTSNMILPSLTYVTRGSNEYKKLDGDLKRIAEKLDGVVIVVWKRKAYRIQ